MAFGITLWVSWISLLFRCTCVSAGNGVQYRPAHAATNLMDDGHEDRFHTLSFDEGNFDEEASNNQPTSTFHASFNKPSVRDPLHMVPSGQRFPEYQTFPNMAIFGGESNLVEPITFPLNQGNQMVGLTPPKPAFVLPQANPYDAYSGPSGTGSAGPLTHFKPSLTSTTLSLPPPKVQPASPGSGETAMSVVYYQQPDTVSSPSNFDTNENSDQFFEEVLNFNTGYTGPQSASDSKPLQYFPSYPSKPSKPSQRYPSVDTGRWYSESNDVNGPWIGGVLQKKLPMRHFLNSAKPQSPGQSNSINPGSSGYATPTWKADDEDWMFSFFPKVFENQNFDFLHSSYQPQNSASDQMDTVSKVYQPARSSKPLKKRIVHSKNGYKRGRFVMSKTAYTPEYQTAPVQDTMVLPPFQRRPRKRPTGIKI
ncbi:uncharacterized protein LOC112145929 [Oryzias melastigma]|uniref:uncharacterized protein LOC112145929 n=1 Tax=Oryzias melastigma TaxID=30732 RepID=UPI000CF7E597|nr:uncharacterized protein LOC112145929 [Oryzias melastigma]